VSAGASLDPNPDSLGTLGDPPRFVASGREHPMASAREHPAVRVPAPFYFAAALLLAWPLQMLSPLTLVRGRAADVLGAVSCMVVAALSALGVRALRRGGTSMRPDRPAAFLVTGGPFAWSRNPIYLSLGILVASLGVWTRNAWMLVLLPPTLLLVTRLVIVPEETYLRRRFEESYRQYRQRVPRWL